MLRYSISSRGPRLAQLLRYTINKAGYSHLTSVIGSPEGPRMDLRATTSCDSASSIRMSHTEGTQGYHSPTVATFVSTPHTPSTDVEPSIVHGFELKKVIPVKELNLKAMIYSHLRTGSRHIHVAKSDNNSAFLISVKTPPVSDSGESHVLEHIALSGSKNFSTRDPFFTMNKRTVSNYMNAFTTPYTTSFTYATENLKDYFNLAGMYLDAVLHPLFRDVDFMREVWRYEVKKAEDGNSDVVSYGGVVFSEMMGGFSAPMDHLLYATFKGAYGNTPYSCYYGGHPAHIPELTNEKLMEYYAKYYHPSKFSTLSYGEVAVDSVLKTLDQKYADYISDRGLNNGTASINANKSVHTDISPKRQEDISSQIPHSTAVLKSEGDGSGAQSRLYSITGPSDNSLRSTESSEDNPYTTVAFIYIMGDVKDIYDKDSLYYLLDDLLVGGPCSPFYKRIIESGLAYGFSSNSGLFDEIPLWSFSIGFRGILMKNIPKVRQIVNEVIDEISESGFDKARIEAYRNTFLVSTKTVSTSFGTNILSSIGQRLSQDIPIEKILDYKTRFDIINKALEDKTILTSIVKSIFKDNKDVYTVQLIHDDAYSREFSRGLQSSATEEFNKFTESQKFAYKKKIEEVNAFQDSCPNPRGLPIVNISDLSKDMKKFNVEIEKFALDGNIGSYDDGTVDLYTRKVDTNGLSYLRIRFDITNLVDEDLMPYLGIYAGSLCSVGLKNLSNADLSVKTGLLLATFSMQPMCVASVDNLNAYSTYLVLQMGCLYENIDKAIDLTFDILFDTDWARDDAKDLKLFLSSVHSELLSEVSSQGSSFATRTSGARLNVPSLYYDDVISGSKYAGAIMAHSKNVENKEEIKLLIDKLTKVQDILKYSAPTRMYIVAESEEHINSGKSQIAKAYMKHGKMKLKGAPTVPVVLSPNDKVGHPGSNAYYVIDSQVSFVVMSIRIIPLSEEDSAALNVLCNIISDQYLHTEIREKLGAYGGGCTMRPRSGTFSLYSYRGPENSIAKTIQVFDKSLVRVLRTDEESITDDILHEAILTTIRDIDVPIAPQNQGVSYFCLDTPYDLVNSRRTKILNVTSEDLKRVALKYLKSPICKSITVVGPQSGLKEIEGISNVNDNSKYEFDVVDFFSMSP